jgi:hypothetical protein
MAHQPDALARENPVDAINSSLVLRASELGGLILALFAARLLAQERLHLPL